MLSLRDYLNFFFFYNSVGADASGYNATVGLKAPSEVIMTDGCGFANKAVLRMVQRRYQFESLPSAMQIRLRGTKVSLIVSVRFTSDHVASYFCAVAGTPPLAPR